MDFPFQPAGSGFGAVEGYLFGDINKDDALDAGDYRFDGVNVTVTWTTADGKNGSETVTTDANGYYVTSFDIPSVAATGRALQRHGVVRRGDHHRRRLHHDAAGGLLRPTPPTPSRWAASVSAPVWKPATPRVDMGGAADPEG